MALVGWRFLKIQQGYLGVMSHLGAGVNALNYEGLATNNLGVKQTYNYTGKTDYGYGIAVDGGLLCGRIVSDRARNRLHPLRSKLF